MEILENQIKIYRRLHKKNKIIVHIADYIYML